MNKVQLSLDNELLSWADVLSQLAGQEIIQLDRLIPSQFRLAPRPLRSFEFDL